MARTRLISLIVATAVALGPAATLDAFGIAETASGLPDMLQVQGDLLYIRQPAGFEILSIEAPDEPLPIGRFDGAANTHEFEVVGDLVVVTDVPSGLAGQLRVVSTADPAHPTEIASLDILYSAHVGLAAGPPADAWTIDGDAGSVHHYSLGDAAHPVEVAYHYDVQATELHSWRDHLLVYSRTAGLLVKRTDHAGGFETIGSADIRGARVGIVTTGTLAAVRLVYDDSWFGDPRHEIVLLDLGDPTRPELRKAWGGTTEDDFVDLAFGCRQLVVAHRDLGVGFADLSLPSAPGELEYVGFTETVAALAAGSAHVYVLTTGGSLAVLANPGCSTSPVRPPVAAE